MMKCGLGCGRLWREITDSEIRTNWLINGRPAWNTTLCTDSRNAGFHSMLSRFPRTFKHNPKEEGCLPLPHRKGSFTCCKVWGIVPLLVTSLTKLINACSIYLVATGNGTSPFINNLNFIFTKHRFRLRSAQIATMH